MGTGVTVGSVQSIVLRMRGAGIKVPSKRLIRGDAEIANQAVKAAIRFNSKSREKELIQMLESPQILGNRNVTRSQIWTIKKRLIKQGVQVPKQQRRKQAQK